MKTIMIIIGLLVFGIIVYNYNSSTNFCEDYVLLKDGYPVATFHGFVEDDVQCKVIAEHYNKLEQEGSHPFKGFFSCMKKDR